MNLAKQLLGKTLTHESEKGSTSGMIVETEAYGANDDANHAASGITSRNAAMFNDPVRAYIYRIYGKYYCFNIVSAKRGLGEQYYFVL